MCVTQAAGAFVFTFCMSGWYVWFSLILSALDFPFTIPLGDLSKRFPSGTAIAERKAKRDAGYNGDTETNGAKVASGTD